MYWLWLLYESWSAYGSCFVFDDHLCRLSRWREFGRTSTSVRPVFCGDLALFHLAHRAADRLGRLFRGVGLDGAVCWQFDVDRQTVGIKPRLFDQFRRGVGDRLEVDVAAKVLFLAQAAGDLDHRLHRLVGVSDHTRGKEQSFDVVAAIEFDGEADDLFHAEPGARHIRRDAVDAIGAIIDAEIRHQDLEKADAAAIGGIGVADAGAFGAAQPLSV